MQLNAFNKIALLQFHLCSFLLQTFCKHVHLHLPFKEESTQTGKYFAHLFCSQKNVIFDMDIENE